MSLNYLKKQHEKERKVAHRSRRRAEFPFVWPLGRAPLSGDSEGARRASLAAVAFLTTATRVSALAEDGLDGDSGRAPRWVQRGQSLCGSHSGRQFIICDIEEIPLNDDVP
jgi:hypothetical protein